MIARLRSHVLKRLARFLLRSGTFRRHMGTLDANLNPRFVRLASLLRGASDAEAVFVRDLVAGVVPEVHLWVVLESRGKTGGYFVEFGATDGVDISSTYLLERDLGWRGILAEPNPVWHEALRRNRKAAIDTRCVFRTTGARVDFAATRAPALATIAEFVGCDGHARSRAEHRVIEVETVSLDDLLDAHGAPRDIDFISIDTEGSELAILERFDFAKWNVRLFSIEHNMTGQERAIDALMGANGYERRYPVCSPIDAWYRKKAPDAG